MTQFRKQVNYYRIRQWADGFYYVYPPDRAECVLKTPDLDEAIELCKEDGAAPVRCEHGVVAESCWVCDPSKLSAARWLFAPQIEAAEQAYKGLDAPN